MEYLSSKFPLFYFLLSLWQNSGFDLDYILRGGNKDVEAPLLSQCASLKAALP